MSDKILHKLWSWSLLFLNIHNRGTLYFLLNTARHLPILLLRPLCHSYRTRLFHLFGSTAGRSRPHPGGFLFWLWDCLGLLLIKVLWGVHWLILHRLIVNILHIYRGWGIGWEVHTPSCWFDALWLGCDVSFLVVLRSGSERRSL